jgi:hypothetical protein
MSEFVNTPYFYKFLIVYNSCTEDLIVTFPYMCTWYTSVRFISSTIFRLPPPPFLKWLVSMLHIHTGLDNTLTIFSLTSTLFICLLPPTSILPLTWPALYSVLHCLSGYLLFSLVFALVYILVNILYFNLSYPLYYSSLSFPPNPYCSRVFHVFCCVLFLHKCNVF